MDNTVTKSKAGIIAYYLIQIVIMSTMFVSFALELSEMWQTPKNLRYYFGVLLSLVLLFLVRKISLKKYEVWASLVIGLLAVMGWFKLKGINAAAYGEIYYPVILFTWISWMLFVVLAIDLIRTFDRKKLLSCAFLWRFVAFTIFIYVAVSTDKMFFIPCMCPILAFVLTKFTRDSWIRFFDCLSISLYFSFVYLMTKSLIVAPNALEEGRYMGLFISVENMGAFSGLGVIAMLYFFVRIKYSSQRKWYWFLLPIAMMAYPIYGVLLTGSRTTMIGIIFALLCMFVFMHGKTEKKVTVRRFVGAVLALTIMVVVLWGTAKYFSNRIKEGAEYSGRQGYVISHIAKLADEEYDGGYFEKGSILNALDGFTSLRVRCWYEALQQIEVKGHPYIPGPSDFASPHNFFLQKLIEMGWIKGFLFHLYIIAGLVMGLVGCLKRDAGCAFPTLWILYAIPVLGSTIISWNSLLPFGMLLFSSMLLLNNHSEVE